MSDIRTTVEHRETTVTQHIVKVHSVEKLENDKDFEFDDYLVATWNPSRPTFPPREDDAEDDGYWLISGDNSGSQQLILYPYEIDGMIELLEKLKAVRDA